MAAWQNVAKYSAPAYNRNSAFIDAANLETARDTDYEYAKTKFAVKNQNVNGPILDLSGADLNASSKIDAATEQELDAAVDWAQQFSFGTDLSTSISVNLIRKKLHTPTSCMHQLNEGDGIPSLDL